jgi:autotransporter-associated beta strand protein
MRAQFVRKGERAPARLALLSGTALVSASLCVALVGAMSFAPTAAFADGGSGGGNGGGGAAGGADSATAAGTNGSPGVIISGFAGGGGGGGAGVTGGTGGTGINGGSFGQGGAGGQTAGASGANGGSPSPGGIGGGGGGGGAHGAVLSTSGGLASSTGGNGGNGGSANIGTGGGGGAGGYGAVVNGSSLTLTSGGTVAGGNGGNGGQSFNSSPLAGGGGGTGGIGLDFTGTANSIVNTGTISGGKGGAGGAGNISGANGAGGAGVVGSDLTVTNSGTITGGLSGDGVTRANAITFTGGTNTLELRPGSSITGNVVAFSAADTLALGGSGSATFDVSTIGSSAQYQGFGTFQKTGSSTWTLTGTTSAVTSWAINAGTLAVSSDSNLGNSSGSLSFSGGTLQFLSGFTTSRTVTLNSGGGTFDTNGNDATLAGTISGTGGLTKIGTGTLTLTGANTYGGGTTVTGGLINFNSASNFGSGLITLNGGGLQWATGTTTDISSQLAAFGSGGATFDTNGNNVTLASNLAGTGGLTKIGAGMLTLSGPSTYTGATFVNVGTLQAGVVNAFSPNSSYNVASGATLALAGFNQTLGSLAGAGAVTLGSATLTTGNDNTSTTFSGGITGAGGLTKIGTGALTLSGPSTYSGTTAVNAGTLIVNGSIANSAVTVNAGATLSGTGTVGGLTINSGGMFAPGNSPGTMTVQGNLAFQSGALYLVQINSTTASNTVVSGSATLAGTVQAAFAAGSYATRMYTILSAAGGLGGTTFNTLTTSNLPAGFTASLSYTATDAILNLTATLGRPSALTCAFSLNQCNVANAINAFFNNGGALPPAFVTIFGLTGANLANALTLLSGEAATGAQQGAFQLTNQFLGIMLDPFVDGRSGASSGGAIGFAPARAELPDDIALAYAKILKEPPKPPPSFEQRWSVWSAGYGGSNRTSGDPAVVGSHDLSAVTAGGAAGLDYRLAPGTVVGFALAGAGTNWGLAQGLGGGKSDAFQAGLYGTTRWGPTYVAAALAFTNHWMSTDRFAFAADHLSASFNAQSFGGRVEGGYRVATIYGGLTPYAAIQAQNFRTPSYSEADLTNGGFALGFNSRNATDTRSELGGRFDRLLLLNPEAALTLRTRVAWAHDWISDPSLAALFQTLPGASFVVNGATPAKNSALTSAGAEYRLANGVVLLAKFDGEFASHASTYAGTGTVRYTW